MEDPGAANTMRSDHVEIIARIDHLGETVDVVLIRWPVPDLVDSLTVQLAGLSAIVGIHFCKEEEVLLPGNWAGC